MVDTLRQVGLINADFDQLTVSMPGNIRNWFGLPYLSANIAYQNYDDDRYALGLETNVLDAGTTLAFSEYNFYGFAGGNYQDIYPQTAPPQFQTVEYDFWNPNPVFNPASQTWTSVPLPGNPAFVPTNQSQLFIAGVGSQIQIAGYAKLAVQNGYPGVYGYLGQYFDQAYKIDDNGNVTTNTTGVLSPYGNFFATESGPAALVTMPDVDTGAQGTCTVYCVSLN